jgi:hypothetical integral membrane protein (TIGR02206 family)
METFVPFGWMHLTVTVVSAIGWLVVVRAARRSVRSGRERVFRWTFGLVILAVSLAATIQFAMREGAQLKDSLPLHACDIAWMLAAWSILSGGDGHRLRHQLLYYWGFGFSSFAYLTPGLEAGAGSILFWEYWSVHWLVLSAALINLVVFGVRPTWRGYLLTVALTAAIVAPMTVFNAVYDTMYFYTGRFEPDNPTIVWMVLIAIALFALMTLPAGFGRRGDT